MSKVTVISSCLVATASNATPMSRLDLTPWDLQLLLLDPIQRGILFHKPRPQETHENFINHLKNSLSHTLDFFPPLAGRIAAAGNTAGDDKWTYFINCNNEGVEFTHAIAPRVFISDILEPRYKPEIISSFFPLNGTSNSEAVSKPVLGVQLTELADGLFIACTANHAVVDGTSFWHFINSWSEISRGFDTISKTPVFERWFPTSVADEDRLVPLPPLEQKLVEPPPLMERVFHYSRENLSKLKDKANSEAGTDKISTFQALSAHLWRSITRCRHSLQCISDTSSQEPCFLMIAIGARGRIPLPDGYFGNAFNGTVVALTEAEVLQNGLGYTAMKINELVSQQTKESVTKPVEDWVKNPRLLQRARKAISNVVMIASSPRHNAYGNDFGWGKPIAVRSGKAGKFDGNIMVYPAAGGGEMDVEVCLAPETFQALGDGPEFVDCRGIDGTN